ncbi:PD-(D/E)XK nuclease-like domain-containing protein [Fibrella aquatilis]|uniref:PD-(D/E)XK nuclease-like domain-containing protein n=1 Tax=Fibrella aquatilis TaxID=2817059 RepID=A0A939G3X5_9BACT|nr:PD-(D/E)XK nuclease-like domain-containing protein [Fibrella aquatilis]MBO0931902.1 PD-(D/E)XK nuclease-like domain-containing protein [Fibrella aquatilis]
MLFQPANYRSYPAYANSDLTEFERFLTAQPNKLPVAAFAEGSAFHQLVLEPRCGRPIPSDIDRERLQKMAAAVRTTRFGRWALQWGQKEQPHLFRHPATGLLCKCQTDLTLRHGLVIDIKTTRARTYRQFLECCEAYQYDRQAAFYLDGLAAKRFVLLGVQKTAPFQVFYFEPTADAIGQEFIQQGRERYNRLLSMIARSSFRPSSWSHEYAGDSMMQLSELHTSQVSLVTSLVAC